MALLYRPVVQLGGETYNLFDVGGAVGVTGMAAMLIAAVAAHTAHLYRAERLP